MTKTKMNLQAFSRTLFFAALVLFSAQARTQQRSIAASFVDPFIGTAQNGNCFPGALRPWGMVSVSPHTAPQTPSGYRHGEEFFYGFGHVHLSGTGCSELGSVILTAEGGEAPVKTDPAHHRTHYSNERAEAGYYSIRLDSVGLAAEATASARCGMTRLTALKDGIYTIVLDMGRSLSLVGGGRVRILSSQEAEGCNISGGFCGETNREKVYAFIRLDRAASLMGTWKGESVTTESEADTVDAPVGMWFRYSLKKGEHVTVRVGISYVSEGGARKNLDAEISTRSFDTLRREAKEEWERELSRIRVEGGSKEDKVKFYTALYHALIHPNIISDADGRYPLTGRRGTGQYNDGRERYSVFSLWDTYRTLHPLLTLVYPKRQSEIVKSMLDIYRESGFLPKWELAGNETYMMVGDGASVVIADSYVKGIRDFDSALAFEAVMKPSAATTPDSAPAIRAGYHEYLRYGFIPADQDTTKQWWVWGPVSTTLEYCLADWALAQMAGSLGKVSEARELLRRSQFYRNLFDPELKLLRPRLSTGAWLTPFDPLAMEGAGNWSGSGGPGYVEGNAWHYAWFVPHDVAGLAELFGGSRACAEMLEEMFSKKRFTIENEPDMGYPYIFTQLAGEEDKAVPIVKKIMSEDFTARASGLPGNDDCGALSAWFVFSALGFYPSLPAADWYAPGYPLFERATIALDPRYYSGSTCSIERKGKAGTHLEELLVNGKKIDARRLLHKDVTEGARVVFRFR